MSVAAHELLNRAQHSTAPNERAALVAQAVQRFAAVAATVHVPSLVRTLSALGAYDGIIDIGAPRVCLSV